VVDALLLRIVINTPEGRRYLVETEEVYPDGRTQKICRLPGNKKEPHENMKQTTDRFLQNMLKMADAGVDFDFRKVQTEETSVDSPSYPGVQTVYRKEIVTGTVSTTDATILKRLGEGKISFQVQDSEDYKRQFSWYDETELKKAGIATGVQGSDDISALVYPPIGLEEQDLLNFLMSNKIDTSAWGTKGRDLSEELVKGAATLVKTPKGNLVRAVDIAVLTIKQGDKILVQIEESHGDSKKSMKRLPATKRRSDEHVFSAVREYLSRHLSFNVNLATIDAADVRMVEEQQESTAYPGLNTVYRKRFLNVQM